MRAQFALLPLMAVLSGCGDSAPDPAAQGSTTPPYLREEVRPLTSGRVQAVRIGEMGPAFAACNARGTPRDRVAGGPIDVRAAPYSQEEAIDRLAPGATFFICSRTHDQRWFGIVYDEGGRVDDRCGVSRPVERRQDYRGPCAAGWVASSEVRLESGVPHLLPAPPSEDTVSTPIG